MITPWRISLLGGLRAQREDEVLTRFRTQKTAALLAYLAFHFRQPQGRDVLTEVLWPEAGFEEGRHSLRMALTSLRHQLEPPDVPAGAVLQADRTTVQLNPDAVQTDVAEFESAVQKTFYTSIEPLPTLLQQAADLYEGPLLPGYYEAWIVPQMLRLQEEYNEVVTRLIALFSSTKEWDSAIRYATRAIAFDPLQEEMHLTLMRLYAESNRTQEALRLYRTWQERLTQEWGQPPSAAMQNLARTLGEGEPPPARPRIPRAAVLKGIPASPDPQSIRTASPAQHAVRLPVPLSRCFGREQEIELLVSRLLPTATEPLRLLNLTGMGGTGKTRLALEVGMRLAETYAHRLAFVSLETVTDAAHMTESIADALHLTRAPHLDVMEQIIQAVAGSPFLLLLDNFEQVAETGGGVVKSLLARCPLLTCLVTSRQLLYLEGEQEFSVPPLPVPGMETRLEALRDCASVRLFINRAQATRPDFQLTPHNARAVAELCNRLDGIPLAIEMAAGWARTLTPVQMLAQMARRFELLVSRRKDLTDRHRSLRVTLDWSYQHLTPPLQQFLTRLSVFRGGWTLEAAETVCSETDALEFLTELRERSLIVAEDEGAEIRFRMLETVREYVGALLSETEKPALHARHLFFFEQKAVTAAPHLTSSATSEWLQRLNAEEDNLRQALEYCCLQPENGLRMAASLWRFWRMNGRWREGLETIQTMLNYPENSTPSLLRARALNGAGNLARSIGKREVARRYLEESLALYQQFGEEQGLAWTLNNLALIGIEAGDYETARTKLEGALEINRRQGSRDLEVTNLINLGRVYDALGEFDLSEHYFQEGLTILHALNHPYWRAFVLNNYGYMLLHQRRCEEAARCCEEALRLWREIGANSDAVYDLANLGYLAAQRAEYALAFGFYQESLETASATSNQKSILITLRWLGYLCGEYEKFETAARLMAAAQCLREGMAIPLLPCEQDEEARNLAHLQAAMGKLEFQRHWNTGSGWGWEEAVASALKVCAENASVPGIGSTNTSP